MFIYIVEKVVHPTSLSACQNKKYTFSQMRDVVSAGITIGSRPRHRTTSALCFGLRQITSLLHNAKNVVRNAVDSVNYRPPLKPKQKERVVIKFFRWLKEKYLCLCGFHGFSNKKDCRREQCSFCGCHFEGYIKSAINEK